MYISICFERLAISRSSGSKKTKPNSLNMKMMIAVALGLVAVAYAVSITEKELEPTKEPIKIISSEVNHEPEGGYDFSYETENGIKQNEKGELKTVPDEDNNPHPVIVVSGSYSYTDNDGKLETINYSADEKGFHAEGDSIPTIAPSRR
ncbi:unnamed protein product [Parnassius apollo]|uniref:(apollo) hypothetical protein n=1 Tax=Parnassius apollo TaxID=110799 RepID=A0A8S3XL97_PARAO|nr:unnamed protein product [Parnassius apollo]